MIYFFIHFYENYYISTTEIFFIYTRKLRKDFSNQDPINISLKGLCIYECAIKNLLI